jgi:Autographiviridae tail tubular protein Gp11
MSDYLQTTELEAVNSMLGTIGESPISTLSISGSVLTEMAKSVLHEISREVQSKGWYFNSEGDYPITPDLSGEITLPLNTLSVDPTNEFPTDDLVQRGSRMYDKKNHTYSIGKTVKFDFIFFLPFTELPESLRRYITIRAARLFQDRTIGSQELRGFTKEDEYQAYADAELADSDAGDFNILSSPSSSMILER